MEMKDQITNSFASRPRRTWIRTTIILVLLLSLLALVWFTHTSKHRGWATRKGIGYVNALVADPRGGVWVGTPLGLSVLNPDIAQSPQDIQAGATARTVLITVGVLGIGMLALLTIASTSSAKSWNRSLRHSLGGFVGWFVLSPVFWAVFLGGLEIVGRSLGEGAITLFPLRKLDNSDENSDTSEALGAYPNNPAARKAVRAQAKCRKAM